MSFFIKPDFTRAWIDQSMPGERVEYAYGRYSSKADSLDKHHPTIRIIRQLYDDGRIDLVQRCVGKDYHYIAIKRRHRQPVEHGNTFAYALYGGEVLKLVK